MTQYFRLALSLFIVVSTSSLYAKTLQSLSSTQLIDEVISSAKSAHAYDYRRGDFQLLVGYSDIIEKNNFEGSSYHFGLNIPLTSGSFIRTKIQRVWVISTDSTQLLARTPYKQVALQSRYEYHADFSYPLFEGKGFSRLSPSTADLETLFSVFAGAAYHNPVSTNSFMSDKPKGLPGQTIFTPSVVLTTGVVWDFFLSSGFGLGFEYRINLPIKDSNSDLVYWGNFSFNLIYGI